MEKWPGFHLLFTSLPAKLKSGISPLISKTAPSSSVLGPTTTQKSISSSSAITPHVTISNRAVSGTLCRCQEGRMKIQTISDTWISPMILSLRGNLCSTPSIWSFPASSSHPWLFWCSISHPTVVRRWRSASQFFWPWLCSYSWSQR